MGGNALLVALHPVLLLLVFAVSGLSAEASELDRYESMTSVGEVADAAAGEFIRQFPVIRVGVSRAPGNGHQAYAVRVMKRLRELGFQGRFEVFYDPEVRSKLEFLLPGFRPDGPDVQDIASFGRVTFVELKKNSLGQFEAAQSSLGQRRVALGIMGGDDLQFSPRNLNVDALVKVQPSGWGKPGTIAIDGQRAGEWIHLEGAVMLPTRVETREIRDAGEFLRGQMGATPGLREKIPGLRGLLEGRDRFELLVTYGWDSRSGPEKLANLVAAVERAAREHPARFRGPVVIPVLSELGAEERKRLEDHLSRIAPGRARIRFGETLRDLRKGEILVMPVGPVPQDVWHALVARSTLPPTVSGRSGVDFVRSRGVPYLDTVQKSGLLPREAGPAAERVDAALEALNSGAHFARPDGPQIGALSDYLVESLDPSSPVNRAFHALGEARRSEPDKVSVSLAEARVHFESIFRAETPVTHCVRDALRSRF